MPQQPQQPLQTYLGDGVYAKYMPINGMIELTAESADINGRTNTIYLEIEVFNALVSFASKIWKPKDEPNTL